MQLKEEESCMWQDICSVIAIHARACATLVVARLHLRSTFCAQLPRPNDLGFRAQAGGYWDEALWERELACEGCALQRGQARSRGQWLI